MRIKSFKCHYCGQEIRGEHKFTLAFQAGFIWNPAKFDRPAWYFDFCRECEQTFVRKYKEGEAERRAQVEAQLLKTWQKRFGIDTRPERRKVIVQTPFTRRRGDQLSLFTDERKIEKWHSPLLPWGYSQAHVHPVVARRQKDAGFVHPAKRGYRKTAY